MCALPFWWGVMLMTHAYGKTKNQLVENNNNTYTSNTILYSLHHKCNLELDEHGKINWKIMKHCKCHIKITIVFMKLIRTVKL